MELVAESTLYLKRFSKCAKVYNSELGPHVGVVRVVIAASESNEHVQLCSALVETKSPKEVQNIA